MQKNFNQLSFKQQTAYHCDIGLTNYNYRVKMTKILSELFDATLRMMYY